MKLPTPQALCIALFVALCGPAPSLVAQDETVGVDARTEARLPARPIALVAARAFTLEEPYRFHVLGERKEVKKGWIVVLKAELPLLRPLNVPDPLLFAGDALGVRINSGYKDGHLVAMIPDCDLEKTPIWFGSRLVPDRMIPQDFELDALRARNAGIEAFSKKEVRAALRIGGAAQVAKDHNELFYLQRHWIERYAPAEKELARSLRPGPTR